MIQVLPPFPLFAADELSNKLNNIVSPFNAIASFYNFLPYYDTLFLTFLQAFFVSFFHFFKFHPFFTGTERLFNEIFSFRRIPAP